MEKDAKAIYESYLAPSAPMEVKWVLPVIISMVSSVCVCVCLYGYYAHGYIHFDNHHPLYIMIIENLYFDLYYNYTNTHITAYSYCVVW